MPSYTVKVPNNDDGEDLGEYEADYLPRVGDPFVLWHPRVCRRKDEPFCAVVSAVTHEAIHVSHPYKSGDVSKVVAVVWLAEEHAAPEIYCDCSKEEQERHAAINEKCENCGHTRRA